MQVAVSVVILGLCLCSALRAQEAWTLKVSEYLYNKDYRAASDHLAGVFDSLDISDKPAAAALLAFCHSRLGDAARERERITAFFETFGGPSVAFPFLDLVSEGEASAYLNARRMRYPHITDISLVRHKDRKDPPWPKALDLGIDVTNATMFKFSDGGGVLLAGSLHPGLNILSVDARYFFNRSENYLFTLDLKSGDIALRKEIVLEVRLTPEPEPAPEKQLAGGKGIEYKLSMYVGERLVVTSSKTSPAANPTRLDIPKTNQVANPLFKPPNPDDPFDLAKTSFSVPAAISVIAGLIKDLVTKKPEKRESSIDKLKNLTLTFFRKGDSGEEAEVKALVSLSVKSVPATR